MVLRYDKYTETDFQVVNSIAHFITSSIFSGYFLLMALYWTKFTFGYLLKSRG